MSSSQHYHLANEKALLAFAAKIANLIDEGLMLFLSGPLGAGKTTFTRGFLRGLGYEYKVKSPTYTLVEPYEVDGRFIFHFDFYRLNDPIDLVQIGFEDYLIPGAICLIEWPEKAETYLPLPDLTCNIAFNENGRVLEVMARSIKGEKILNQLVDAL
jgi:tRNA threonylcarbamoyladenosine biosynthesis protein TsaE